MTTAALLVLLAAVANGVALAAPPPLPPIASSAGGASAPGVAEEEEPRRMPCLRCDKTGVTECKYHKEQELELERTILRCSEMVPCEACAGTFLMECPDCSNRPEASTVAAWEANRAWLEGLREIDELVKRRKRPVCHGESAHFILTFGVEDLPSGRRSVTCHDGMHLYLERLETLYADVLKDLRATDKDFLAKTHVMIWDREKDLVKTAAEYCRQISNTKSYLIGAAPIFTIYYNKGYLHEEFELHQAVVHNVVHCLVSNVWDGMWPGNLGGGWLDAGYAHHYELKYFGHLGGVRHYCYREGDTMGHRFKFGKWEPTILQLVTRDGCIPFVEIAGKNTDLLSPAEHMYAWSYVDFLLKEHPDAFPQVLRLLKKRKPIGEVTKEALDMTPFQFEDEWKTFVETTYQLKPNRDRSGGR